MISVAALAVPFADTAFSASDSPSSALLWLLALVPAFMLAYYRGWRGAATSLAAGMAALSIAVCVALWRQGNLEQEMLLPVIAVYITIALATGWLSELLHGEREQAELLALTDELTGLANRRRARMKLEMALANAGPATKLSVVLFDLDEFKRYNDLNGHPAGDVMLRLFADVLASACGPTDLVARYGGEEFLAVLSACDEACAFEFAERVRAGLVSSQTDSRVTVSAGIAVYGMWRTASDLIVAADRALYQAKQQGRDRACIASPLVAANG